jgi:hypothetical protein
MSDASELLRERSRSYLLDLGLQIEHDLARQDATDPTLEQTFELGRAQFTQINALLKAMLDARDEKSFTEAECEWAKIFDSLYFPDHEEEVDTAGLPGEVPSQARRLARYRQVLWLGLAMWAAHLRARSEREAAEDMPLAALRTLSRHFTDIETLLDVFEQASEEDAEDRLPWTSWFLGELPTREAHFIPTRSELLFTAVLLITVSGGIEGISLGPREWLRWRFDELTAALDRLDSDAERWSTLMPAPAKEDTAGEDPGLSWWHRRVAIVRQAFTLAQSETEAAEQARVRQAPLDDEKVGDFCRKILAATRKSRLIHDIFALQGGMEHLPHQPKDHTPLFSVSWMPKSSFTKDSTVVGLDMSANELGNGIIRAESTQLLSTLDAVEPANNGEDLVAAVEQSVQELRDRGLHPSLILIPLGWNLAQALGLQRWPKRTHQHPLIPILRSKDFEGVLHDVPVLALPRAPKDRLWVVDLARTAHYREWPSQEQSGIQLEFKSFDTNAAKAMLEEHPEVRPEGEDNAQAVRTLEERVLVSLRLCWEIRLSDHTSGVCLSVPEELQR